MTKMRLFLICISIFYTFNSKAQNIDSLNTAFKNTKIDSIKSNLFHELVSAYENNDVSYQFAREYLAYAIKNKKIALQTDAYDELGEICRRLGRFSEAKNFLNKGLLLKKRNNDKKEIAISYNKLGKVYANESNYVASVRNFISALKLMEELNDKKGQSYYLNNIGILYDMQGAYQKSLNYYQKSLNIKKELKDSASIATTLTNIGIVYFNLNQYQESLKYQKQALRIQLKTGNERKIARLYNNIGFANIYLKKYNKALEYSFKALKIRKKNKDTEELATTLNNIGTTYFKLKRYKLALNYVKQSLDIANKTGSKALLKSTYLIYAQILEKQNKIVESYSYYKKYVTIKDSILNKDMNKSIAEMEAKYKNEKNEKELQERQFELDKKNIEIHGKGKQLTYVLIVLFVSLIGGGIAYYAYRQKKRVSKLLYGQNLLVEERNNNLNKINSSINHELAEHKNRLEAVFQENSKKEFPPEIISLSKRELEVLSYLALGWTDQEISEKLFISKSTTKTHLRRIYNKLLVKNRAEAVNIAHRYSIIGGN